MKRLKYIPLLFTLLLSSCTDLDEVLYDKIPEDKYPENDGQLSAISVDAYARLRPLIDDEGWWFLAQEVSSDEFCAPTRDTDWDDGGKWRRIHQHTWTDEDEAVRNMWNTLYAGVTRCNQIIEQLGTLPASETITNKIKEIEVMRAFYYYLLIDNYGDVPYLKTASDAPEQPFKTKRATIYADLVKTIEDNVVGLKDVDAKYMATQRMANALLAKLYLNAEVYSGTAQWTKAEAAVDKVLEAGYTLSKNVRDPFLTNNDKSSEIIFSIPFDEDNFKGFRLHMRSLHYSLNQKFEMSVSPWNGLCSTFDQFKRYEDNDLRKDAYFIYGLQKKPNGDIILDNNKELLIDPFLPKLQMDQNNTFEEIKFSGARVGKYEIKAGAKENLSNDFPLFRISDFYLMKAETAIRNGKDGKEWFNEIRKRAGINELATVTLQDILDERARELWVEGHRRQDQIRFGKWEERWWEKAQTDGSKRTFPIPKSAKDANPNLAADAK